MARNTILPDSSSVADQLHADLAGVLTTVLEGYLSATSNEVGAFHADYDGLNEIPGGTYIIGRNELSEDQDSPEVGIDYALRKFRNPNPTRGNQTRGKEYLYGRYGWMDVSDLGRELPILRQVVIAAVERGYVDRMVVDRFDKAADQFRNELRWVREQYDLSALVDLLRENEMDTLRDLLITSDEDGRVIWQLLFSKDESGEVVSNTVEVPVVSKQDQFLFARTDRYYYDRSTGKGSHYAYGVIIGYDDTPERFFIHRIESDIDLRDDDTQWTPDLVKEKMGFEYNLREIDPSDPPLEATVRVQGDLALTRYDLQTVRQEYEQQLLDTRLSRILRKHSQAVVDAVPELVETDGLRVSTYSGYVSVLATSTDELRELQQRVDVDEKDVRAEQDARGYQRLTASRRQEIVTDLLDARVERYGLETAGLSNADVAEDVHGQVAERFTQTESQRNEVVGNHSIILGNVTPHPNRAYGETDGQSYIVPEEADAMALVLHDEHDNKQFDLAPGVYTFGFLNGFEDEPWMSNG